MNIDKVTQKLDRIPMLEIAQQSRFIKTSRFVITPQDFVVGFLAMACHGLNTLEKWATYIANLSGHLISKQALHSRLQFPQVDFCELLLGWVIGKQIGINEHFSTSSLFSHFRGVYVEDSTIIGLPKSLYRYFAGSINQVSSTASARIQLCMELKTGKYSRFSIQGYRDNDQKHAPKVLDDLQRGDLLIRDLGYFVVRVFKQITQQGAFFLSRYKANTHLYDPVSGQQISLAKQLRRLRAKGISVLDQEVLLGKQDKVAVRLIAIKASPCIEQKRKRQVNKDRRNNPSADYLELLGWTIFVTNVSKEVWTPTQVLKVYGLRWRIEIIFKCWKRHFDITKLFKRKSSMSLPRIYISIYLMLLAVTLTFVNAYSRALIEVYERTGKILSMIKFSDYIKSGILQDEINFTDWDIQLLARYCCHEQKKTPSYLEILYGLNFT